MDFYISLSYATFLLIEDSGYIVKAPPIAKWTIRKRLTLVLEHYRRKKAKIILSNQNKKNVYYK